MKRPRTSPVLTVLIAIALVGLPAAATLGCDGDETTTTVAPLETTTPLTSPDGETETTVPDTTSPSGPDVTVPDSESPQTTVPNTTVPNTTKTTVQPPYTPPKGDPDRAAIMDAQRAWMASKGLPSNVVFVVDWLRISSGWAYSQVRPQSPDGSNQYEGIMFLLRDTGGWKVVDVFGTEGEMAEDLDPTAQLTARNPEAPRSIFP